MDIHQNVYSDFLWVVEFWLVVLFLLTYLCFLFFYTEHMITCIPEKTRGEMPSLDNIYRSAICPFLIRRGSAVNSRGLSWHLGRKIVLNITCYFSPSIGILTSVLNVSPQIDFLSSVKKKLLADANPGELFLKNLDCEPLQGQAAIYLILPKTPWHLYYHKDCNSWRFANMNSSRRFWG